MLTTRSRFKVLSEIAEDSVVECAASPVLQLDVQLDGGGANQVETRKDRRRKKIVQELFDTEKTYLHHLEIAHKFFEFPLKFNCVIPEDAHSKLFSNLEQILEVNRKLLEYMEQTTIGTAFKFLGPFLKLYSTYANNHGQASSTLQEYVLKNPEFAQFIQSQEERPELGGLKLGALLITPVQRIPRYKLLLEDLVENTASDHHDYDVLTEATKQISQIATHINEHVRRHENFQKMLNIQNSFDSSAPRILAPGREFIREGVLKKIARRGGKAQERMFFLFSDVLLYGKPKFLDSGARSYTCCCVLPLRHCEVEKVLGSLQRSDGGGMFRITCKEESLLLYSGDPEEIRSWIEILEDAIRKLCNNRQTLRKPSSNKVPIRTKSLIRLRLQEKKTDLKRKVLQPGKSKEADSSKLKDGLSPLRGKLQELNESEIVNCSTPIKRQRVKDDGETEENSSCYPEDLDEASDISSRPNCFIDDQENEVDLDTYSSEISCVNQNKDIPVESFMQTTLDNLETSAISNNPFDCVPKELNYTDVYKSNVEEYQTLKKMQNLENGNCMEGPFRKIRNVTSSVGGMMGSVRKSRCSIQ